MAAGGRRAPTPSRVFVPAAALGRLPPASLDGALRRAVEASPADAVDALVVMGTVAPQRLQRAAMGLRVALVVVYGPQRPIDPALLEVLARQGEARARLEICTPAWTEAMADALGLPARVATASRSAAEDALRLGLATSVRLQLTRQTTSALGAAIENALALGVARAGGVSAGELDVGVVIDAVPPREDVVRAGAVVLIDELEDALSGWLSTATAADRARVQLSELWPDGVVGDNPGQPRAPLSPDERRRWFAPDGRRSSELAAPLAEALASAGRPEWRPGAAGARLDLDPTCVEARGLALGLRRVWRLRLDDGELERFRRVFEAEGLVVRASSLRFAEQTGGSLRPAADEATDQAERGLRLVAVAHNEADALACLQHETANATRPDPTSPEQARAALAANAAAHRSLGAAYGYPPCCVEAFIDAHEEAIRDAGSRARDNAVALRRALQRSAAVVPALHSVGTALAIAPASLLRHMPCRFDCVASVRLADALARDLRQVQPSLAASLPDAPPAIVALADGGLLLVHEHGGVVLPADAPPRAARRVRAPTALQPVPAELAGVAARAALEAFAAAAEGCAWIEASPDEALVARGTEGRVIATLPSAGAGFPVLIPFGPRVDDAGEAVLSSGTSSGGG
jgi:hypothetical protein